MQRHFHYENDPLAGWLLGGEAEGTRYNTGPISTSPLVPGGLDQVEGGRRRKPAATSATLATPPGMGVDAHESRVTTAGDPIADPSAQHFPDGRPSVLAAVRDTAVRDRLQGMLAPLPAAMRQGVLDSPHTESVSPVLEVSCLLEERLSNLLPAGGLSLAMMDRLEGLPPADRIRVLVDTLAQIHGPLTTGQAGPYLVRLERSLQTAYDGLKGFVLAGLSPAVKSSLSDLSTGLQDKVLTVRLGVDAVSGEYQAQIPDERVAQNLILELHAAYGGDVPPSLFQCPPGLPAPIHDALLGLPPAQAIAAMGRVFNTADMSAPTAAMLTDRVTTEVLRELTNALPVSMRSAIDGLDPAVRLQVLTTDMPHQGLETFASQVQANLEAMTRQVAMHLPGPIQNQAFQTLGLTRMPTAGAALTPPHSNIATMARFLKGVPLPSAAATIGPQPLIATVTVSPAACQSASDNLSVLRTEDSQAATVTKLLDPATRPVVDALLKQGLLSSVDLLGMVRTADGTLPATAAIATERVTKGLANLVTRNLQLTDPKTFQPAVGETDAQGNRWQPQQIAAIATVVLRGQADGMTGGWTDIHFALETPVAAQDATFFDKDISGMRYGHFDQGDPGKPPTMYFSSLDANPQASSDVRDGWKKLWGEIASGQHFHGGGTVDSRSMAGMLQTYLQAQQLSRIAGIQAPVMRGLSLQIKQVAKRTPPDDDQRFAERLSMTNSGLRSDAVSRLWALHKVATLAADPSASAAASTEASHRLRDYLGTVSVEGPEAQQIRDYLGGDLAKLAPDQPVESWLANPNNTSRREPETLTVPNGSNLPLILQREGGGRGPTAILEFLRLNQGITGRTAISVTVSPASAKQLGLQGRTVNGLTLLTAAAYVEQVDRHQKALTDFRQKYGSQLDPTANPKRLLTLTSAEAHLIGLPASPGKAGTTVTAESVLKRLQLTQSLTEDSIRDTNVNLMEGAVVKLPPRTLGFSDNPSRQMEIDSTDARTQMLAFVGKQLKTDLLATAGKQATTISDGITGIQKAEVPLQEDGRFGPATMEAMKKLEQETKMANGFDPTIWYRSMLQTSMNLDDKQNFYVALATHEMAGHGDEEGVLTRFMEPVEDQLGGSKAAYDQAFQFFGYGVYGFLDGAGQPPKPGDVDSMTNDPTVVAAHGTQGSQSLAGGTYTFNPSASFITPYAKSSPAEAWAESTRYFVQYPDKLLRDSPEAFLFLNAVMGRYTADQVMTMASSSAGFQSETAAKARLTTAMNQLLNVRHPAINPAVVNHLFASEVMQRLSDRVRSDSAVPALPQIMADLALSGPSVPIASGPEQRALNGLIDHPDKAIAWQAAVTTLQPHNGDTTTAANRSLIGGARAALAGVGLNPLDISAIPDTTILRWVVEADDMVTVAHLRSVVQQAEDPLAESTAQYAKLRLARCLQSSVDLIPADGFPVGVWAKTSPVLQAKLTNSLFIGDLTSPPGRQPQSTYVAVFYEPHDLIDELGQPRLTQRAQAFDRLQNQVAMNLEGLARGKKPVGDATDTLSGMLQIIKNDISGNPGLRDEYNQYLDRMTAALTFYQNPDSGADKPAGLMPLNGHTPASCASAQQLIQTIRQQLGLNPTSPGPVDTTSH